MEIVRINRNGATYSIRPGGNPDIASICAVVFNVLLEYGLTPDTNGKDQDLADIETNFLANGGFFGILTTDIQVIGTFGLFRLDHRTCELRKMYLLKPFRGQGLGKFMLATALEEARRLGFSKVTLETVRLLDRMK